MKNSKNGINVYFLMSIRYNPQKLIDRNNKKENGD